MTVECLIQPLIASIAETEKKLQEVPDDFPIGNVLYYLYNSHQL